MQKVYSPWKPNEKAVPPQDNNLFNFEHANWKQHWFFGDTRTPLDTIFLHWTIVKLSRRPKICNLPPTLPWEDSTEAKLLSSSPSSSLSFCGNQLLKSEPTHLIYFIFIALCRKPAKRNILLSLNGCSLGTYTVHLCC